MMTPLRYPMAAFFRASLAATASISGEIAVLTATYFLLTGGDLPVSFAERVIGVLGMSFGAAIWSIIPAFVVTFTTVSVLGLPTLWILRRSGWDSKRPCMLAGAVVGASAGAVLGPLVGMNGAGSAAFVTLPGVVAGWVILRRLSPTCAEIRPSLSGINPKPLRPSPAPPA